MGMMSNNMMTENMLFKIILVCSVDEMLLTILCLK